MANGKIQLERGDLGSVWAGGRGYQPPSPHPGGGGNQPPEGWEPPVTENTMPEDDEIQLNAQPPPTPDIMEAVRAEVERLQIPNEQINLDNGTARFRGHTLTLSPESIARIKKLMAQEVVLKLEEEQRRVLESVLEPELPKPSGSGKDVPVVQAGEAQMGAGKPKRSAKVQRMRVSAPAAGPADVRPLPRAKGGKT